MRKLAIDLGSDNIKIYGYDDNGEIVNKLIKSKATPYSIDNNHVVEYDGKKIHFGVGNSLIKNDKTEREYIIETILLSTYYITDKDYIELNIGLGLPLDLYKSKKRELYEQYLNTMYSNQYIVGIVNNREIQIKISNIEIFAEGYSAFVYIYDKLPNIKEFTIMDFGYRTTDVLSFSVNIEGEVYIDNYMTVNHGIYDVNNAILNGMSDSINYKIDLGVFENCLINDIPIKVGMKNYDISEYYDFGHLMVSQIFNEIELNIPDIKSKVNYLIGGGTKLIYNIYNDCDLDIQVVSCDIEECLYANVIGIYLQIE